MELEFEKYCIVDGSPKTVLPYSRHCPNVGKNNAKGKSNCGNDLWSLDEDFMEISFRKYCSSSCRSFSSRSRIQSNEVLRRGSLYQSSSEVKRAIKIESGEERRKIEFSRCGGTDFSFGIDSLCNSDDENQQVDVMRSPVRSQNSDLNITSVIKPHIEPCISSNISLDSHSRETLSSGVPEFRCDPALNPPKDNGLQETDLALTFPRFLSAKWTLPHSPARSESDRSRASSPKARFGSIRKMFDPFMKSNSHFRKNSLDVAKEPCELSKSRLEGTSRDRTFQKSLLNDFSNTAERVEFDSLFLKGYNSSTTPYSPAHLHGCLKLENKHGMPSFEFSVKSPEEVFVAKTWKVDSAFNWVYTFHSIHRRRKNSASGWGLKDGNRETSIVGQMQVSCYSCTELENSGALDNSMVTEFVLYDIASARKSVPSQDNSNCSPDVAKPHKNLKEMDDISDQTKLVLPPRHNSDSSRFESSIPHPWPAADLNPNLEIAAIVVQIPFEKRESLKFKRGDMRSDLPTPKVMDQSVVDQRKKPGCSSPVKVNVVTPSGNHSLPTAENHGPSPLLDRWRLGGGCDCGGWDMACPLTVFGNPDIRTAEDDSWMENSWPLQLFVRGARENPPSLSIKEMEEGRYEVNFHAQLSTLQAFSICVAILHCAEASIAVGQERDKQMLQCSSLRLFIEEEVKHLLGAVAEEKERKVNKAVEKIPTSFVVNPPFSPIARV